MHLLRNDFGTIAAITPVLRQSAKPEVFPLPLPSAAAQARVLPTDSRGLGQSIRERVGRKSGHPGRSDSGQSRQFERAPITSGLPRKADNFRVGRHVSKVQLLDHYVSIEITKVPNMPPRAVPPTSRLAVPAPSAIANGTKPRLKAKPVITGRIRSAATPGRTKGRTRLRAARLAVKIDPSGQLLDSFFDLNNLALSRFSPEERNWYGTGVDIEDRKRAESLIAVEKQDGG